MAWVPPSIRHSEPTPPLQISTNPATRPHEHYRGRPHFCLLDRTTVDTSLHYGFRAQARGSFYNSLHVARALLVANGVARSKITLLEATEDYRITTDASVDLLVSLLSWGHHYAVDTYLPAVAKVMKPGGTVILDVRRGTGGEDKLAQLGPLSVIDESCKQRRCLVRYTS